MTKEKMTEIIRETERKLEKELSAVEKDGMGSVAHKLTLASWASVYRLMEQLGIEPDRGNLT